MCVTFNITIYLYPKDTIAIFLFTKTISYSRIRFENFQMQFNGNYRHFEVGII